MPKKISEDYTKLQPCPSNRSAERNIYNIPIHKTSRYKSSVLYRTIKLSKLGTTYQLKSKLLIQILRKLYKHTSQRQSTRQKFEQMTLSQQSLDSSKVNNSYTYNTLLFYVCKLFCPNFPKI